MKLKCGCIIRKITKPEKDDYPEEVKWICDEACEEHQKIMDGEEDE